MSTKSIFDNVIPFVYLVEAFREGCGDYDAVLDSTPISGCNQFADTCAVNCVTAQPSLLVHAIGKARDLGANWGRTRGQILQTGGTIRAIHHSLASGEWDDPSGSRAAYVGGAVLVARPPIDRHMEIVTLSYVAYAAYEDFAVEQVAA